MTEQIIKLIFQLLLIGVVGGAISWFYSHIQKQRELRISLLKEFASLQGKFVSLRFRFNSFHIEWEGQRNSNNHPLNKEESRKERWLHFQEACELLGEFYSIKPLLISQFKNVSDDIESIHQNYQFWRRQIGGNKPVLQSKDGKSDEKYKDLRSQYQRVIQIMRNQL